MALESQIFRSTNKHVKLKPPQNILVTVQPKSTIGNPGPTL